MFKKLKIFFNHLVGSLFGDPVLKWYKSDQELKAIIDSISNSNLSEDEQANLLFDSLSEHYDLVKYPDDITDEVFERFEQLGMDDPRSLFEEIGIIRFLKPKADPNGLVIQAAYHLLNYTYIDIDYCAKKHFGNIKKIPNSYMIYYSGEKADSILNFAAENESWAKPGIKYGSKVVHI